MGDRPRAQYAYEDVPIDGLALARFLSARDGVHVGVWHTGTVRPVRIDAATGAWHPACPDVVIRPDGTLYLPAFDTAEKGSGHAANL